MTVRQSTAVAILGWMLAGVFFVWPDVVSAGEVKVRRLAVFEFDNSTGLAPEEIQYFAQKMRGYATTLLARWNIAVMTPGNMLEYLGPDANPAQCEEEAECMIELGRKVSADYMVTGKAIKFGKKLKITMEMLSVSDNALMSDAELDGTALPELEKGIPEAAEKLFGVLQRQNAAMSIHPSPSAQSGPRIKGNAITVPTGRLIVQVSPSKVDPVSRTTWTVV